MLRDFLECDVRCLSEIGLNRGQRVEFLNAVLVYFGYHLDAISARIHERLAQLAADYGLAVPEFAVNGSILDRESRERLETVFAMRARQQAAEEVHLSYERLEQIQAMRDAARTENGLAGAGLQLGTGLELAAQLLAPSAPPTATDDLAGRLRLLQQLLQRLCDGRLILHKQEFHPFPSPFFCFRIPS